jgi:CheY-like chemotaxis protein
MALLADVLVVEDEPDVRGSVADILRGAGYDVEEACDGVEALDVLADHQVGAVLLDLRMPRRDGISVVQALDDPPPIVIVSAHHLDAAEREKLGPKVVAVLKKPVPPPKLLAQLSSLLRPEAPC